MTSKNYEWYIKTDTSKYAGKWIAILNQRVVASGDDAKRVYEEAKAKSQPGDEISIAKVPPHGLMILEELLG